MSKITKRAAALLFLGILLLLLAVRIWIGHEKSYFHMDEAYSYGLMNYDRLNITDNPDFLNEWHDSSYYADYLEVGSDELSDWTPVYENQKNDVHPPLYYCFLRRQRR